MQTNEEHASEESGIISFFSIKEGTFVGFRHSRIITLYFTDR